MRPAVLHRAFSRPSLRSPRDLDHDAHPRCQRRPDEATAAARHRQPRRRRRRGRPRAARRSPDHRQRSLGQERRVAGHGRGGVRAGGCRGRGRRRDPGRHPLRAGRPDRARRLDAPAVGRRRRPRRLLRAAARRRREGRRRPAGPRPAGAHGARRREAVRRRRGQRDGVEQGARAGRAGGADPPRRPLPGPACRARHAGHPVQQPPAGVLLERGRDRAGGDRLRREAGAGGACGLLRHGRCAARHAAVAPVAGARRDDVRGAGGSRPGAPARLARGGALGDEALDRWTGVPEHRRPVPTSPVHRG
jgi:hypothetical protein